MNVWRERLGRWLDPLARRSPLSPDSITILALLLALAGAWGIGTADSLPHLLVSLLIVVLAGVLDAFDGVVARARNQTSPFGDFLDHLCDRVADVALVIGWMIGAGVDPALVLMTALSILLNGYAGTQLEATFHVRTYEGAGRGEFMIAIVALPLISYFTRTSGPMFRHLSISDLLAGALLVASLLATASRVVAARRLGAERRQES